MPRTRRTLCGVRRRAGAHVAAACRTAFWVRFCAATLRAAARPDTSERAVPYFNPNHSVAMPRKEKKPTTSVTVVTNVPEATAGSALHPFERHRDQDAAERAGDEVADDGEPDDDAEAGILNQATAAMPVITRKGETVDEADQASRASPRARH